MFSVMTKSDFLSSSDENKKKEWLNLVMIVKSVHLAVFFSFTKTKVDANFT